MNAPSLIPTDTLPVLIDRAGYVYAIRSDASEAVKIGFSASPVKRLRQLQTASPSALRLLCAIPAFQAYEATMHETFASRRLAGEWFDDSDGFVTRTMEGTAAFLRRCGLTISDILALAETKPVTMQDVRVSADARNAHADALEAEGQISGAA